MHLRRIGLIGAIAGLVFVLAACSATTGTPTTSSGSGASSTASGSTAATTPSSTSANPSGSASASLSSPMASPTGQAVSLATAFKNLQDQNSYVMTATLDNVGGTFAQMTGDMSHMTLRIERSGNDRHLKVTNGKGDTVFQLWQVNGSVWADLGSGPTKIGSNNVLVSQFSAMLLSDQQLIDAFSSSSPNWQVVGSDTLNGTAANVLTSQYTIDGSRGALFHANGNARVDAKMWVAQSGNYLLKAQFTFSGNGAGGASSTAVPSFFGTPIPGAPMNATATSNGGGQVTIDVTQIGQVQSIQAPSS